MTRRELLAAAAVAAHIPKQKRTQTYWANAMEYICKRRGPFLLADLPVNYQHAATICRLLREAGLLSVNNSVGRVNIYWWTEEWPL